MVQFDLAIIGGGINGAGIARDAAGRGLKVALIEQGDLASGTSSASTKLIHGGLRYLETYEFRLVREALIEREVLLSIAPHIIWPMRFVLPHHSGLRPRWLLRLGLFLYDRLGGRKLLPPTASIDLTANFLGAPLRKDYTRAFEYSDCWVDDARLVVLNAIDAAAHGATILTHTRCVSAERGAQHWAIEVQERGGSRLITARALVNAAGPWVTQVDAIVRQGLVTPPVRLVKGSHIIVPRLFTHDRAYLFQNADGRVVFAIPYENDFTLIGTTDEDFTGDPASAMITPHEVAYLCEVASAYFQTPVTPGAVVWSYAGVRPLYDDGESAAKDASRDYVLSLDLEAARPPVLTIYGGKITTYRKLAEAALQRLAPCLGQSKAWTASVPLPGGDFAPAAAARLITDAMRRWPFLTERDARRFVRAYGTRVERILGSAADWDDLGPFFGAGLTAAEVRYLLCEEWAETADDILWRRSKLGLHMSADERIALENFLNPPIKSAGGQRTDVQLSDSH
jgi:glycerol-3-phosphate dehydrogenase